MNRHWFGDEPLDANALAMVAAATILVAGVGSLYYAFRQSGDKLVEDQAAVDEAIKSIDPVRLSNVLPRE